MPKATLDALERMDAIMRTADALIALDDPAALAELRGLRLRMAGALTSFQLAFNNHVLALTRNGDPRLGELQRVSAEWVRLGDEFRAFTALNQSAAPPPWNAYVPRARTFMRRFDTQMSAVRRLLA